MKKIVLMTLFSGLFFLCTISEVLSQKQGKEKVDSLIERLDHYKADDSLKVDLYRDISFEYYGIDPGKGIEYGEKGVALAEKLNYRNGIIFCLISTGVCNWASSNFPKALDLLFKALRIAEATGNKIAIAKATGNIGNIYADQKNYTRALEYYKKALAISEELNDTKGMARKLGNIGTIYKEMIPPDQPMALEYYFKALKLYEQIGEIRGILVTIENISWVYSDQSKYKEAIAYLGKAKEFIDKTGELRWVMYYYGTTGEAYYKLATDTTAKYRKTLNSLSKKEREKSLSLSLGYLLKAIATAKQIKAEKQMIDWYGDISEAYKDLGNWEPAFKYADSSNRLFYQVFTVENKIKIETLDAKRETEVKEKEIALQQVRLDKANIQRVAGAVGLILLIIIILVIYLARRKSESLLLNMLPAKIARRLKKKEKPIADMFENAAVVFIDIVDFTGFAKDKDPHSIIEMLTDFFGRIDELSDIFGMEKIKTIGDSYMAVSGVPEPSADSIGNAARFAIRCRDMMKEYKTPDGQKISVRIGIDAGQVIAGVIGEKRFSYDLWGDVVNTASRMEALGVEGEIQITERFVKKLDGTFTTRERGEIEVKGQGLMKTWILS